MRRSLAQETAGGNLTTKIANVHEVHWQPQTELR